MYYSRFYLALKSENEREASRGSFNQLYVSCYVIMTGEKWLRSGNVIAEDTRGKSYAAYFNSREEQESATLVLSADRSLGSVYIHCNRKTLVPKNVFINQK